MSKKRDPRCIGNGHYGCDCDDAVLYDEADDWARRYASEVVRANKAEAALAVSYSTLKFYANIENWKSKPDGKLLPYNETSSLAEIDKGAMARVVLGAKDKT